jgi:RhtB (resistance to homoserine/threonine) family protein
MECDNVAFTVKRMPMFGIENLPLFLFSCVLLNITPGQDSMYIIGRSVAQGRSAGIFSVLGIMSGVLIHTLFAALGLSVILTTSSVAFGIIKYLGAAYLIWLGVGFLRSKGNQANPAAEEKTRRLRPWKVYRQGVLTNVLNPKVALFFLSFLPQFVDTQAGFAFLSFMTLGLIFFATGTIWCLILVFGSSWIAKRFRTSTTMGGYLRKVTGLLFVGLGIKLALSQAE